MDKRDNLTQKMFDETTVKVVDSTDGAFTAWFNGDILRIARLSGAPAHSTVTITYLDRGGFRLTATGPNIQGTMVRMVMMGEQQTRPFMVLVNSAFSLPPELRGQKIGARSLAIELLEAQATGEFEHVEVVAAGNAGTLNPADPADQVAGYAVWPQLGFDGPVPEAAKQSHPELRPFNTVKEVLDSPDGLELWLRCGDTCLLEFKLAADSTSWVVLRRYMDDNGIQVER